MDKIRESRKFNDRENMEESKTTPFYKKDFVQREMFDAVCDDCHGECKVPFKPIEGRPLFCRDCFKKRKGF